MRSDIPQDSYRILIVDDNPDIHRDIIKILDKSISSKDELERLEGEIFNEVPATKSIMPKLTIDTATQGDQAVVDVEQAVKNRSPYALAFVDVRMPPGMDGIETVKQMWGVDPDIQVVICTAYSDYSWEETVNQLGPKENLLILKKPFDSIAVRQLVCSLTKKWQLMSDVRSYTTNLEMQIAERTLSLQESLKNLEYQATHDVLTGLANRALLVQKISSAISAATSDSHFALLFLDLDRFKLINDSLSHSCGDEVLKTMSARLKKVVGPNDTVARLSGDEFVVLYTGITNNDAILDKLIQLQQAFDALMVLNGHKVIISASIGVSIFPKDGGNPDELLRNADAAMYRAKEHRGNSFQFYTADLNASSLAKLEEEMRLRDALAKNEFFLCYQPQVDINQRKIVAAEALLRWKHPEQGDLLPVSFMHLAEETGLIVPTGEWVLREACRQNKEWQNKGLPPIRMAVNVTAQQFLNQDVVLLIKNVLAETGLDAKYLELELTENAVVNNPDIIRSLEELKQLGVVIAIDDFGTGYSSLSYLNKIPLDRLKIDSSFVQHIQSPNGDEAIIRAIVAMAKNMNIEILAEGVETVDQLNFLKSHECTDVQGYYFSRPLTADKFEALLQNPSAMDLLKDL